MTSNGRNEKRANFVIGFALSSPRRRYDIGSLIQYSLKTNDVRTLQRQHGIQDDLRLRQSACDGGDALMDFFLEISLELRPEAPLRGIRAKVTEISNLTYLELDRGMYIVCGN